MILLPAIDLFNGECVRLAQGKFDQVTVYYKNPIDAAEKWTAAGAEWLHIVDLNGALEGKPINQEIIKQIIVRTGLKVEIGGGIRDESTARDYLELGATRVILGSIVLENRRLTEALCQLYPGQIGIGLDAKDGKVATRGWITNSNQDAITVARELELYQPACLIYTDIARDGMLTGPNLPALERMVKMTRIPVIASGGISSVADLQALKPSGVVGAILGKALYEGRIDLAQALITN